jgi:hypothetical protein
MRSLAILALLAAFAPCSTAQRGPATGHLASPGRTISRHSIHAGDFSFSPGYGRFSRYAEPYPYLSLPFPFFADSDSDDIYSTGYPVAAPLPPYLPVPTHAYSRDEGDSGMGFRTASASQPLMIELQNGRYVQVSHAAINGEPLPLDSGLSEPTPQIGEGATNAGPMIATSHASDLTPVTLIFRDGHSEQVRDYTIANGTLYARGDFYTDGYWNKNIDLTSLNLPQTVLANARRNVIFLLPSSPNEVIARF